DGVRFGTVAPRIHHDRRAAFRKRQRDGAPDVAAGAGDDGDLAREFLCHPYPRNDERSMRPLYNVPISFNAASACALLQPPCSALSRNLSTTSCRVNGSWAPPRKKSCRPPTTLPPLSVARRCPV